MQCFLDRISFLIGIGVPAKFPSGLPEIHCSAKLQAFVSFVSNNPTKHWGVKTLVVSNKKPYSTKTIGNKVTQYFEVNKKY